MSPLRQRVLALCGCLMVVGCSARMTDAERQTAFIGYTERVTSLVDEAVPKLEHTIEEEIEHREGACQDTYGDSAQCDGWASGGECTNNVAFMQQNCCGACQRYRAEEAAKDEAAEILLKEDEIWQQEYVRSIANNSSEPILLSKKPCAFLLPNFMTDAAIEEAVKNALPRLHPQAFGNLKEEARTSWGSTFRGGFAADVIKHAEHLVSTTSSDGLEVKRYRENEYYWSHHDYFSTPTSEMKGDRVATFLIYLRSAEAGGETMFPWRGGRERINPETGWPYRAMDVHHECDSAMPKGALKVPVMRGSAVLFYSLHPSGEVDPYSQHGSCPVLQGEKWTATIWTRARDRLGADERWKHNKLVQMCQD